jgi:hypothetical protein
MPEIAWNPIAELPPARYKHDCDGCTYLGQEGIWDLYGHFEAGDVRLTARIGDGPEDAYWALASVLCVPGPIADASYVLIEAMRRGVQLDLRRWPRWNPNLDCYGDELAEATENVCADDAVLLVFGGHAGDGLQINIQSPELMTFLPSALRDAAEIIERQRG